MGKTMVFSRFLRFCGTVLLLLSVGCSRLELPPAMDQMIPRSILGIPIPRRPRPIRIENAQPVTLAPGSAQIVETRIDRVGNEGPLTVEVTGVPEGITVTLEPVAQEGSSMRLTIAASPSLGDEEFESSVSVVARVGENVAREAIVVRVPKVSRPEFQPVDEIVLQPGTKHTVKIPVLRNGFEGPLGITLGQLPMRISGTVADLPARADSMVLALEAEADAEQGRSEIGMVTSLYGRDIKLTIPLSVIRRPFQLEVPRGARLSAGQTVRIPLGFHRGVYKGGVRLVAMGLPSGVTMRELDLPTDGSEVDLELQADEAAEPCVGSAMVKATGGHLNEQEPLVVRVVNDATEGWWLPQVIVESEKARAMLRVGSIAGRTTTECKRALSDLFGSSPESEACVKSGLEWLAKCQQPDGSWTLRGEAPGQIGESGIADDEPEDNATAGTALGLLPFLAEGVTHKPTSYAGEDLAKYQGVVKNGLAFLAQRQVSSRDGTNGYLGGGIVGHTLGTIALCEGFGLSNNKRLKLHAQDAIEYLQSQQLPGGGWRSGSHPTADMVGTAWAILAIRCGQLLRVTVKGDPLEDAERFVDSCCVGPTDAKRARYGLAPAAEADFEATAAALLVRQYLGWQRTNPDLVEGCSYLMKNQPPKEGREPGEIGFFFFATPVLRNMEGEDFDLWNHRMREHLIRTQEKNGPMGGSWDPRATDIGSQAGRTRATSMALLTLQVYYRHLPIYREIGPREGESPDVGGSDDDSGAAD